MMSKLALILRGGLIVLLLSTFNIIDTSAQCPMCRMSLESNLKNGGTQGRGMNAGIMYLLMTPYLIVGGIGFVWYRNRKKKADMALEEDLATVTMVK